MDIRAAYFNNFERIIYTVIFYISPLVFLIFILRPLYFLTVDRNGLLILLSKSICLLLWIFCVSLRTIIFIFEGNTNLLKTYSPMHIFLFYTLRYTDFNVQLHIVALAMNRCYAAYWPLQYNGHKKNKILRHCALLWFLTAIIMAIDGPLILNNMNPETNFFYEQFYYLFYDVSSTIAGIFYLILAAKLINWYSRRNLGLNRAAIAERNFNQIAAAFAGSLLFTMLNNYLVGFVDLANYAKMGVPMATQKLIFWCIRVTFMATLFSDELLLLILVPDFRALCRAHFQWICRGICPCWAQRNGRRNGQPQIPIPIVPIGNLVQNLSTTG